jgi:hypothetical protein
MKNILLCSFILFGLFACNSSNKQIEKTWITKYRISDEGEISPSNGRGLLKFDRDSVTFSDFKYIDGGQKEVWKLKYSLYGSNLITFSLDGNDTIAILLNDSQLKFKVAPDKKSVFEVLPIYNQAKEEEKLLDYLTSYTYKIGADTFEFFYEFQKDYTVFNTASHSESLLDARSNWRLIKHGTELFLVWNNTDESALHIKEIREEEIISVAYGEADQEVILQRVLPQNKFDLLNLIGEWEEIVDYPEPPPPPPPPPLPPGQKHYKKEILKISKGELIRHRFSGSDTVQWQANRLEDKLFIPEYVQKIGAWTIEELDEEYLSIKRKWIYSRGLSLKWVRKDWSQKDLIEHIKFRKIKK